KCETSNYCVERNCHHVHSSFYEIRLRVARTTTDRQDSSRIRPNELKQIRSTRLVIVPAPPLGRDRLLGDEKLVIAAFLIQYVKQRIDLQAMVHFVQPSSFKVCIGQVMHLEFREVGKADETRKAALRIGIGRRGAE